MNNAIRTLTIRFENEIQQYEVPLFRGCILSAMKGEADVLFHNHDGDKLRYSYPLVQYKRVGKKACIVCVQEGADVIGQLFTTQEFHIQLGKRDMDLQIEALIPRKTIVQVWDSVFHYNLRRWLPLNTVNYQRFQAIDDENLKIIFLENILKGNLLSMLKGLGIHIESELVLRITQLSNPYYLYNKGVGLMAFNADFVCNLSIPNYVGIGKNASIGYGIVYHQNNRDKDKQTSISE